MDTLRYNLLVPIGMARRRLTSMKAKSFPCPSTPWRMVTGLPSSPLVASSLVGACPHGRHTSKPNLLHIRHHPSFALGCLLRMQFDVHPVRCFEHRGFVLLRKGQRKKVEIPYPKPRPQKRPHFTTKNVGTHSGCPHCWRSFVSTFGLRNGVHVSCAGAGPHKEWYQTHGRRSICPGMPIFSDSGYNASQMVL